MRKRSGGISVRVVFFLLLLSFPVQAAVDIFYSLETVNEHRWKATYEVSNSSYFPLIQWFTIFYDYGLYDHLTVETLPPLENQWLEDTKNPLFVDPVTFPGYYDAQTSPAGIAPGQTVMGFTVSFDWLGEGLPTGGQRFEIYDPQSPSTSWIGTTAYIPEPATLFILFVGMLAVITRPFKHRHFA